MADLINWFLKRRRDRKAKRILKKRRRWIYNTTFLDSLSDKEIDILGNYLIRLEFEDVKDKTVLKEKQQEFENFTQIHKKMVIYQKGEQHGVLPDD